MKCDRADVPKGRISRTVGAAGEGGGMGEIMDGRKGLTIVRSSSIVAMLFAVACAAVLFGSATAYAETGQAQVGNLVAAAGDTVTTVAAYGTDSINTTGTANVRTVYRFGWVSGGNNNSKEGSTSNLDVTGDGWADKIKVVGNRTSSTSGYLSSIKVTVNGKKVMSYSNYSNYINRAVVSVVTLKNKHPFLWVNLLDGKGNAIQRLYGYDDGSFDKVFSNKAVAKKNTSNPIITALVADNNKINVTFRVSTSVTGITKLKYTYAYEDGWLERTSDGTSDVSYVTNDSGSFTKNSLTAAGTFKVYKGTKLKKVAFTVKSGKKVSIQSVRIKGKKLLYKVKYGSKTGWVACPKIKKKTSKAPSTLFYEAYGQVKLKSSIPEYSALKAFSASDLQKYNDHSLYVARNEICARHGYTFSNGELRNRFMYKSWYPKVRSSLNYVEQANLDLIASIERNRGSYYAA